MKISKLDREERAILMALGIFLVLSLTIVLLIRAGVFETMPKEPRDRLQPTIAETAAPTAGIPIHIGAYIENIYAFSPDDETFDANGWAWLIWPPEAQQILQSHNLSPENWLRFVNRVYDWDFKLEPVNDHETRLQDGRLYQRFKFAGQFYVHELDFHRFPFQRVRLPLVFELAETGQRSGTPDFVLIPDQASSGVGLYIDVIGYKTGTFNIAVARHHYATHFGLTEQGAEPVTTRQVSFVVTYQRSVNAALLTLFLPLTVIMALVLFAPMLSASLWEIRLSLPPMALLTLIFLQQGYRETLPVLPYATYMDLVYNTCYVANLILFGLFLWGSNQLHQSPEGDKAAMTARLDAIDRRFQIGLTLVITLVAVLNWAVLSARYD